MTRLWRAAALLAALLGCVTTFSQLTITGAPTVHTVNEGASNTDACKVTVSASEAVTWSLVSNPGNRFSFQSSGASVVVSCVSLAGLDFDLGSHEHTVILRASSASKGTKDMNIVYWIKASNEPPVWSTSTTAYTMETYEGVAAGVPLGWSGRSLCTDPDQEEVAFSTLTTGFSCNAKTGAIMYAGEYDLDPPTSAPATVLVTVVCSDGKTSTAHDVSVTIKDKNDNVPIIASNQAYNLEVISRDTGTTAAYIEATDNDVDKTTSGKMIFDAPRTQIGQYFYFPSPSVGTMKVRQILDWELNQPREVLVTITDQGTDRKNTVSVTLTVTLVDPSSTQMTQQTEPATAATTAGTGTTVAGSGGSGGSATAAVTIPSGSSSGVNPMVIGLAIGGAGLLLVAALFAGLAWYKNHKEDPYYDDRPREKPRRRSPPRSRSPKQKRARSP